MPVLPPGSYRHSLELLLDLLRLHQREGTFRENPALIPAVADMVRNRLAEMDRQQQEEVEKSK